MGHLTKSLHVTFFFFLFFLFLLFLFFLSPMISQLKSAWRLCLEKVRTEFLFGQKWGRQNAKNRNRIVVVKKSPLSLDVFQNRAVRALFLFCLVAVRTHTPYLVSSFVRSFVRRSQN